MFRMINLGGSFILIVLAITAFNECLISWLRTLDKADAGERVVADVTGATSTVVGGFSSGHHMMSRCDNWPWLVDRSSFDKSITAVPGYEMKLLFSFASLSKRSIEWMKKKTDRGRWWWRAVRLDGRRGAPNRAGRRLWGEVWRRPAATATLPRRTFRWTSGRPWRAASASRTALASPATPSTVDVQFSFFKYRNTAAVTLSELWTQSSEKENNPGKFRCYTFQKTNEALIKIGTCCSSSRTLLR